MTSSVPLPGPPPLRAAVIIDYQNVHLTGSKLYYPYDALHDHLVHPLHFANQLITARNMNQRAGGKKAALRSVCVYRGLPSAEHDPESAAFNLAQKSEWERDSRVNVTHRPLKYKYEYDATGSRVNDINGKYIVKGKQEKGIDVLCALAVIREASRADIDVVILASQDTDLEPALVEAQLMGNAKVETVSWWEPQSPRGSRELRVQPRVWNTRLNKQAFDACIDQKQYS